MADSRIIMRTPKSVQGSEFKYTIVDVEWANLNSPNAFPGNLRYFYTLMSRSSDGNIVIKKDRNIHPEERNGTIWEQ